MAGENLPDAIQQDETPAGFPHRSREHSPPCRARPAPAPRSLHTPRRCDPIVFTSRGKSLVPNHPSLASEAPGKEFCWRMQGGSVGWHQLGVDVWWLIRAVDGESESTNLVDFPAEGGQSLPKTARSPMSSENQSFMQKTQLFPPKSCFGRGSPGSRASSEY